MSSTTGIYIERTGQARPEVVAEGLTGERAYDLALNIRHTVRTGERLYIADATTFRTICER